VDSRFNQRATKGPSPYTHHNQLHQPRERLDLPISYKPQHRDPAGNCPDGTTSSLVMPSSSSNFCGGGLFNISRLFIPRYISTIQFDSWEELVSGKGSSTGCGRHIATYFMSEKEQKSEIDHHCFVSDSVGWTNRPCSGKQHLCRCFQYCPDTYNPRGCIGDQWTMSNAL